MGVDEAISAIQSHLSDANKNIQALKAKDELSSVRAELVKLKESLQKADAQDNKGLEKEIADLKDGMNLLNSALDSQKEEFDGELSKLKDNVREPVDVEGLKSEFEKLPVDKRALNNSLN